MTFETTVFPTFETTVFPRKRKRSINYFVSLLHFWYFPQNRNNFCQNLIIILNDLKCGFKVGLFEKWDIFVIAKGIFYHNFFQF